jgi:hypothetical protein
MADTTHGRGERPTDDADVSIRGIVWAAAGLGLLIAVTFAAMYGLFDRLMTREARLSPPASPLAERYRRAEPPPPRLQREPIADLRALRAEESRLLETYGWGDRAQGTVRIPIERAMELLAARQTARSRD